MCTVEYTMQNFTNILIYEKTDSKTESYKERES